MLQKILDSSVFVRCLETENFDNGYFGNDNPPKRVVTPRKTTLPKNADYYGNDEHNQCTAKIPPMASKTLIGKKT